MTFAFDPLLYIIAMILMGLGGAFYGSAPAALVGDVIKGRGGRVIAFFQMAGDAGMMIGPIVLGLIKDQASFQASFLATVALFLVSFVLVYSLPKRIPGEKDAPTGEIRLNPRED